MNELIGVKFMLRHGHVYVALVRKEDAKLWVQQHASRGFKLRGVETVYGKCYQTGTDFSLEVAEIIGIHTVVLEAIATTQQGQVPPASGVPNMTTEVALR